MQRELDPVKRHHVADQALKPRIAEHAAHPFALDRLEQWDERDPRKQIDVELGKSDAERYATDDAQRETSRSIKRPVQGVPNSSRSGITPAHGGWPWKRS